jgi:hypothetical protein
MVAACTSQGGDGATVPVVSSGPVDAEWLPHSDGPPGTFLAALLNGTLRIDVGNRCVTVEQTGSDTEFVVVWVDGAVLDITDPEAPVLIRANGARLMDGTSVTIGGGAWSADPDFANSSDPAYRNVEIPATCQRDAVWMAAPDR